jgi:hypothetical protein
VRYSYFTPPKKVPVLNNPYVLFPLIAAVTIPAAVAWNRYYIKRLIRKEFRKQLRAELRGEQTTTIYRMNWRQ